jgi:hypothetical protein
MLRGLRSLSLFHAPNSIRNPGSWSHKGAEEFTTPAWEKGKEECYSAPFDAMPSSSASNGAKPDGSMDTTGMSATKGNIKRGKDSAPAPKDEKK